MLSTASGMTAGAQNLKMPVCLRLIFHDVMLVLGQSRGTCNHLIETLGLGLVFCGLVCPCPRMDVSVCFVPHTSLICTCWVCVSFLVGKFYLIQKCNNMITTFTVTRGATTVATKNFTRWLADNPYLVWGFSHPLGSGYRSKQQNISSWDRLCQYFMDKPTFKVGVWFSHFILPT